MYVAFSVQRGAHAAVFIIQNSRSHVRLFIDYRTGHIVPPREKKKLE
jgi:hypothetical protein